MVKRKRKGKIICFILLTIIMSLAGAFAGFAGVMDSSDILSFNNDIKKNVHAYFSDDLFAMGVNLSNDNIYLEADIEGENLYSFGTKERPFTGTFDGQGHTFSVTCWESLFGYIGKGGVIKNTNFVLESDADPFCLENNGVIENCKITANHYLDKEVSLTSSILANVNNGTIRGVMVKGELYINEEQNSPFLFGGLAAINRGEIKSCISNLNILDNPYTNEEGIYAGSGKLATIGAAIGISSGIVKNVAAYIPNGTYMSDKINSKVLIFNSLAKLFNEDNIFINLNFDKRYWMQLESDYFVKAGVLNEA